MGAIWRNAVRKTCECTQQTTMKPPKATTATTNHKTPHPSDKIRTLWGKIVKQTAKTVWQRSYGRPGQHLLIEAWKAQHTMINRATKEAITANRSVSEHDEKLHEMELKWCRERPGIFPDHIHITFAAVRSHLEARDAK